MIKTKEIILWSLVVTFFLAQNAFLNHQVEHFEETDHSDSCLVCLTGSSGISFVSQDTISLPFFEKELQLYESFDFVKTHLHHQLLPRSPPNKMI